MKKNWSPQNGRRSLKIIYLCLISRIYNSIIIRPITQCNLKSDRMISVPFQGRPFNITVIQVYAPTSNTEEAEIEWFYEDLQDLLELTRLKNVLFIIGDWNAKVGRQETPGVTGKFGLGVQNEAGQRLIVLPRERTGHSKHPPPTTQEKTLHMDITRWSIPKSDWSVIAIFFPRKSVSLSWFLSFFPQVESQVNYKVSQTANLEGNWGWQIGESFLPLSLAAPFPHGLQF